MKITLILCILLLVTLSGCSQRDGQLSASEAAAITASDVHNSHLNTMATLDQIAHKMPAPASEGRVAASSINTSY